jgi:NAD(P)-dependent dehydrogenase (short-subunit alcohol dehydrogenase family)
MKRVYDNKVCIVTGAASGIGKAVCQALLELGAKVVAVDINVDALKAWLAEYGDGDGSIRAATLDVTDYDAFKALIEETVAEHRQLDFLFNIAGITIVGEARDLTIEHWRRVLAVDLDGSVNGSTLAYQQMVKQRHGHIVNVASIQGLIPIPMEAPYVVAKFGVVGLSQALCVEGAELGVKVSVVCPGYVKTPIFSKSVMVNLDREKHLKSLESWERYSISPEGCAQVILKGVSRNKAIIPVTRLAALMWWVARLSPGLMINTLRKDLAKARTVR